MKKVFLFLAVCILLLASYSYAEELTILFTGETHAALYHCSCPVEPDGGVARRATLIKQIRKDNPNVLLLDTGAFFAGGTMDSYTQSEPQDKERTLLDLKAMEEMKYDAVAIGDEEFNFGEEFLKENIQKSILSFLSCNFKGEKVRPYIIKEVSGLKIGIIGITSPLALQKVSGLKLTDTKEALGQAVAELKKKNVNTVILLSHLGESEDAQLLKEIKGIDILITGHATPSVEPFSKIDSAIVLRPSWQGRRLGKAVFQVKENRLVEPKVEALRLSDQIPEDDGILKFLPGCFSDNNCHKQGLSGTCKNPGILNARCEFAPLTKISLLVITAKDCLSCDTARAISGLKARFPGINVSYSDYSEKKAQKYIQDLGIKGLPAYIIGKEITKDKGFEGFKNNLEQAGGYYLLKPQFSGIGYYVERKRISGRLDIFISLYDKNAGRLLDALKEFKPNLHLLASQNKEGAFEAAAGSAEAEEYLRAVCVQKYSPENFWDYLICRAKAVSSSWWEDCAVKPELEKIKSCARGPEGVTLLKENISLNKELGVMFGPTYLLENKEIFGIQGVPAKEDLKKLLKR